MFPLAACRPKGGYNRPRLSGLSAALTTYDGHGTDLFPDSMAQLVIMQNMQIYSMNPLWTSAEVDAVLRTIPNSSFATPVLNIGVGNAAPTGIWRVPPNPADPSTWTGLEAIYQANHKANPWTITYNGGISENSLLGNVIGSGEKTWTGGKADANNITAQRFAVSASTQGTIGDIRIKVTGNVNLKVAIYDDDGVGGAPRTLLAYSAGTACISGWNTILLNIQVALTTGNYYLAVITQASNMVWQLADAGAISYYAAANYADAFPNPVPALSFIARDYAIAGWGLKVV